MITSNSANICDQPLENKGVKEVNTIVNTIWEVFDRFIRLNNSKAHPALFQKQKNPKIKETNKCNCNDNK